MAYFATTLFLCAGLINLDFSRGWWRGQQLRLAIGLPLVAAYVYVEMPPLVFPQALTFLLLTLVPNTAFSVLLSARSIVISRRIVSMRRAPMVPYFIATAAVAAVAAILAVAPVVDASGLRDVPDVALASAAPPSAALEHVRVVPQESAEFAGDKVIGQLGAYYQVGDYNVQVENGRLVWVAPLEFRDPVKWLTMHTSPGVIVVSAEDPDAQAELRAREPMRYVPSALLNDNLFRHVYLTYGYEEILETTLQLDDRGVPQYLATLGRPTIGWTGEKVTAVVIVDPSTGVMRRVPRADFASLPKWVRRIYPPDLALAYNSWFGAYVHGWWNAHLTQTGVHLPARDEVFGLLLTSDEFVWFVDHTSPSQRDQSMTGFTYMDTVTGKVTYYTSSGGEFNSIAAERAVASNPLVRQGKLIPTQAVLYHAFGRNTWVVPIVADTGKYQTLALVEADNGHVIVGNPGVSSPQADAFAQYRAFLGGAAVGGAGMRSVAGVIDRVAAAGSHLVFTLAGGRQIYDLDAGGDPVMLLVRSGDRVAFKAFDSGGHLEIRDFSDRNLAP